MLGRGDFCQLTKMDSQALTSRARRSQLPFDVDQKKYGRGYSLFEAYLTIIADDFASEPALALGWASGIAARLPSALTHYWSAIRHDTERMFAGDKVQHEVLCGAAWCLSPSPPCGFLPVCGTLSDISGSLQNDIPFRLSLTSASRAGAVLLRRAAQHRIEVPDAFWSDDFNYRPVNRPSLSDRMRARLGLDSQPTTNKDGDQGND